MYVSLSTFYEFTVFTFFNYFPFIKNGGKVKLSARVKDGLYSIDFIENRYP